MDSAELVERLRDANVPEAFYEIAGVHDVAVQPDAYYFLRREADANAWAVGLRQRSQDRVIQRFGTEAAACAYLYDTLTDLPTPSSEVAEPLEKLLSNAEEIQRRAWEDFDRSRGAVDDT